ncbi:16381_t:CDS:2, partial [Gigaspora margarita]
IDPKRLTKEQLLSELTKRNIKTNETIKKDGLIKELELAMASEIREQKEGDVDKSKRFTAASMLEYLKSKVKKGELDEDEIPKLQTIQDWIACYSAQHRQKIAKKSIEILSNNYPELDK